MAWTETVTMKLANLFPAGVDNALRTFAESRQVERLIHTYTIRKLASVEKLNRVLVVSDTNIGDAVFLQSSARIIKHYFPACTVDYIYQKIAHPLIKMNPYIDNAYPLFKDTNFTSTRNSEAIENLIAKHHYDLVINLYPFFSNGALKYAECPVIVPYRFVANIIGKTRDKLSEPPHVLLQLYQNITDLVFLLPKHLRPRKRVLPFPGNQLYLSHSSLYKAEQLCKQFSIRPDQPVFFLNPDTSSKYTLIPLAVQIQILQSVLKADDRIQILVGPGFTFPDVVKSLGRALTGDQNRRVVFLPKSASIDTYAAMIDMADVFVTGDTAQMHIAAAFKISDRAGFSFQNQTALIALFGATHSHIYGYDSCSEQHLSSSQYAESLTFSGNPACKNLTCIHKTRKKCPKVNCFNGLKTRAVIQAIVDQFDLSARVETLKGKPCYSND